MKKIEQREEGELIQLLHQKVLKRDLEERESQRRITTRLKAAMK